MARCKIIQKLTLAFFIDRTSDKEASAAGIESFGPPSPRGKQRYFKGYIVTSF